MPQEPMYIEEVSSTKLQTEFNNLRIQELADSGELKVVLKRNGHPKNPPEGEPVCTHSQILYYYTLNGDPIAVVHRFLRPDGSIGASGKHDPKRIWLGNRVLFVRSRK